MSNGGAELDLFRMYAHGSRGSKLVPHIAELAGDGSRWMPDQERVYLCGREAAELHYKVERYEPPYVAKTCSRCTKEASRRG